jgi:TP901 family phage tail tape measure protein
MATSKMIVQTVYTAKDKVSGAFRKMGRGAKSFADATNKAFRKASKSASVFGSVLKGILAAGAIRAAFNALKMGVQGVTTEFISFDDAITAAGAKFGGIRRGTEEFERLQKVAREVGATTQFTATQAGEGLDFLAMAGFNANQAIALLPKTVDLATTANIDLARATDIASDALGSFGLMTDDTAQLTTNLARVNDVFAKTVTTANTDLEMLFEAMKDGGPVATAAGASIETFAALTGTMANAGIKGSKAGTTLKNMFLRLAAPVPKSAALLNKLNITTKDSSGNMLDMVDILGQLGHATRNMGTAQRSAALDTIFGKRAIAGASVLLDKGHVALGEYVEQLKNAGGASQDMADIIRKSLGNKLAALKSAAIEVGFKFIDSFQKKIPGAIDKATKAVRGFDVNKVINAIKDFAGFIKEAVDWIKKLDFAIFGIIGALAAYEVALKVVAAINIVVKMMAFTKAVKGATVAQTLLNAAMMANPAVLFAVGIGILIAAGYLLIKNWEEIKFFFGVLLEVLVDGVESIVDSFSFAWKVIGAGLDGMLVAMLEKINSFTNTVSEFLGVENKLRIDIEALGLGDMETKLKKIYADEKDQEQWRKAVALDRDRSRLHALNNLTAADRERQKETQAFLKTQAKISEGAKTTKALPMSDIFAPGLEIPGMSIPEIEAPNKAKTESRMAETAALQERIGSVQGKLTIEDKTGRAKLEKKTTGGTPMVDIGMAGASI